MKPDYTNYVNAYIGTSYNPHIHSWGTSDYGGTVPFVCPPFAMTKWAPQTRNNCIGTAVYSYDDAQIIGFMATHQPAIWMGDYGYLSVMPQLGTGKSDVSQRGFSFDRRSEFVSPYLYRVDLKDTDGRVIHAEMTATERCAKLRFCFPAGQARIYLEVSRNDAEGEAFFPDNGRSVCVSNPDRMDQHLSDIPLPNFRGYYALEFSQNYCAIESTAEEKVESLSLKGKNLGIWLNFVFETETTVEIDIGSSFISYEQALKNIQNEIGNQTFSELCTSLKTTWNDNLGKIKIPFTDTEQCEIFYTAMYHAMLFPHIFSENGKYYSAYDDQIHNGTMYTSFSIWDTFRAANSLLTILFPERVDGMIESLLHIYQEGGYLPKWPNPSYTNIMISTHADSLIAEAINKGFRGFDMEMAWKAVEKDGLIPPPGDTERAWRDREPNLPYEARSGLSYLMEYGYIPTDRTAEAASRTIEGSYDDWCIAQVANATNRESDAKYFLERSLAYRKLFEPNSKLLCGRKIDGSFDLPTVGWTEGGQWNYHFFTPHDMSGMISMVGRENYIHQLDTYFEKGYNFHPNEPSHHVPYLYALVGEPAKAKAQIEKIARENYSTDPAGGLTGNEDCGQMSAWYIFSALGFYPVNPASGEYVVVCPLLNEITVSVGQDKDFTIRKLNSTSGNQQVARILLNGEALNKPTIRYSDIMAGSTLEFIMEDVT